MIILIISALFDFCKYYMHASIPEDFDFVPDIGLGPGFGLDLGQLLARCLVLLLHRLHLSINFH